MNSWDLNGKRALVTGGTKGIGKAIVLELLGLGAEVVFTARKQQDVADVEGELRQMGYFVHGNDSDVTGPQRRWRRQEPVGLTKKKPRRSEALTICVEPKTGHASY